MDKISGKWQNSLNSTIYDNFSFIKFLLCIFAQINQPLFFNMHFLIQMTNWIIGSHCCRHIKYVAPRKTFLFFLHFQNKGTRLFAVTRHHHVMDWKALYPYAASFSTFWSFTKLSRYWNGKNSTILLVVLSYDNFEAANESKIDQQPIKLKYHSILTGCRKLENYRTLCPDIHRYIGPVMQKYMENKKMAQIFRYVWEINLWRDLW